MERKAIERRGLPVTTTDEELGNAMIAARAVEKGFASKAFKRR